MASLILTRRKALIGIVAAPFICRSTSLMRVTKSLYIRPRTFIVTSIFRSQEEGTSMIAEPEDGGASSLIWGAGSGYSVGDRIEVGP